MATTQEEKDAIHHCQHCRHFEGDKQNKREDERDKERAQETQEMYMVERYLQQYLRKPASYGPAGPPSYHGPCTTCTQSTRPLVLPGKHFKPLSVGGSAVVIKGHLPVRRRARRQQSSRRRTARSFLARARSFSERAFQALSDDGLTPPWSNEPLLAESGRRLLFLNL